MECGRKMIYFATYENGVKVRSSGYAGMFIRGEVCDVQIYYRGVTDSGEEQVSPVYIFGDGTVTQGDTIVIEEGMGAATFRTGRLDFMQSGRSLEELEVIYLDGVASGICGGRMDGLGLTEEVSCTMGSGSDLETELVPVLEKEEVQQEREVWSFSEVLERLPDLKLPMDGMRRACCRMTLKDIEHLPEEFLKLKENHFLLHGYYEYHHLLFVKLASRYGERYAIGVPGEFCYRNQYMAENFGFYDFAPLEPGRRRGGSFGYWYTYLN